MKAKRKKNPIKQKEAKLRPFESISEVELAEFRKHKARGTVPKAPTFLTPKLPAQRKFVKGAKPVYPKLPTGTESTYQTRRKTGETRDDYFPPAGVDKTKEYVEAFNAGRRLKNPSSLPNIEKSGFHKGEYVGYSNGVWRITRYGKQWRAIKRDGKGIIDAKTLAILSSKLENEARGLNPVRVLKKKPACFSVETKIRKSDAWVVHGATHRTLAEAKRAAVEWGERGFYARVMG